MKVARITIDLALPDHRPVTDTVIQSLEDLAGIMLVQAEDGLYTGGDPDADDAEHVLDWGKYDNDGRTSFSSHVEIVDVDSEGSASRQHYIDTGVFLTAEEAESWNDLAPVEPLPKHCRWCADGACHHIDTPAQEV